MNPEIARRPVAERLREWLIARCLAPINLDGSQVSDVTIDGDSVSEVTMDGDQVFVGAIPDSEADQKLSNRWTYSEGSGGAVADSVGTNDGTITGASWTGGDYSGNYALSGDGVDDNINCGQLPDFMDSSCAIAWTQKTSDTTASHMWGARGSSNAQLLTVRNNENINGSNQGDMYFQFWDQSDNRLEFATSGESLFNGSTYRVVVNIPDITASPAAPEIWINQTQVSVDVNGSRDGGLTDTGAFTADFIHFAWDNQGTIQEFTNGIMDDVCIFDASLTSTEIQSYNNPWQ